MCKKVRRVLFLAACLLLVIDIRCYSQFVSADLAGQVALEFLSSNDKLYDGTPEILGVQALGSNREPSMYAISTTSHWVLVAGDLRVEPILAYSDGPSGVFPTKEEMSPGMEYLLMWYENQIDALRELDDESVHSKWGDQNKTTRYKTFVLPLLVKSGNENVWGQSENSSLSPDSSKVYNKRCPYNSCSGYNYGHTAVGCNAVAMGQIMWYWQWPQYSVAKTDNGQFLFRDYDWSLMPYRLTNGSSTEEANSTATLLHDAGTSISSTYGCDSTSASPSNIPYALRGVYGYESNGMIYRSYYTDREWRSLIKGELDSLRPVIYVGYQTASYIGGHTFVVDGYDIHLRFHVNFGWRGTDNGYFYLDNIYGATSNYQFNYCQAAITGIRISPSFCADTIIPSTASTPYGFTILRGGGITIAGKSFSNSSYKGRIYSGQYVRLTAGTGISSGASVHIAIKDDFCNDDNAFAPAPTRLGMPSFMDRISFAAFTVTPNPATNHITISCAEPLAAAMIYNLSGQLVLRATETEINVSALPAGVYVVHAQTSNGQQLQAKFVKL